MWDSVNAAIVEAIEQGWLIDLRGKLPEHATRRFAQRVPADILGDCSHHTGHPSQSLKGYASYHVGSNHVSSKGCPGLLYSAAIDDAGQAYLCRDFADITWSQGKGYKDGREDWSGDENRHLVAILVMGDFDSPGHRGKSGTPTNKAIATWRRLTAWLGQLFGYGPGARFGHFDFGKRACPGSLLQTLIECSRAGSAQLETDKDWQDALLRWKPDCLPVWGPDDDWGTESRAALAAFERAHSHRVDGLRDPFVELLLTRKYPSPESVHLHRLGG